MIHASAHFLVPGLRRAALHHTGGQVSTALTYASPGEALGAIIAALPMGTPRVAADLIAAQSAVETADWKSMHNWNMGNVTPTALQATLGKWMDQGLPMRYIAYSNILAGAKGMVGWLKSHGLLAPASVGDLDGYMAQLQNSCYLGCIGLTDPTGHTVSQDDYDNYRAGIATRMNRMASVTPIAPTSLWLKLLGVTVLSAAAGGGAWYYGTRIAA